MNAGQLSFFSVGARPAAPDDLEGLLCGPGQVVRSGEAARLSVIVHDPWRVGALLEAIRETGIDAETVTTLAEHAVDVRTPFDARLTPLAVRWSGGGAKRSPADLSLDGPRLRLWALTAGRNDQLGYVLGLGENDDSAWPGVGAALMRTGLPAALLGPRAEGPAYRVTGQKRIRRLAELVGEAPAGWPVGYWPGG